MKQFFIFITLTIALVSCGKEEPIIDDPVIENPILEDSDDEYIPPEEEDLYHDITDCLEATYDSEITLRVSDVICFPDGSALTFSNIEHQLCPCGALCFWEGDLYVIFATTTENSTEVVPKKFFQSGALYKPEIFDGYQISSFSYTYGAEEEEVPECAEDFEPEKITITFSISPL